MATHSVSWTGSTGALKYFFPEGWTNQAAGPTSVWVASGFVERVTVKGLEVANDGFYKIEVHDAAQYGADNLPVPARSTNLGPFQITAGSIATILGQRHPRADSITGVTLDAKTRRFSAVANTTSVTESGAMIFDVSVPCHFGMIIVYSGDAANLAPDITVTYTPYIVGSVRRSSALTRIVQSEGYQLLT